MGEWEMRVISKCACWAVVAIVAGVSAARADTTYDYFYTTNQSDYDSVAPDSTVQFDVYLQEVNSDQSTNSFLASEQGLYSAGVRITLSSSSDKNPTTIVGVTPNYSSSGAPAGFDTIADASYDSASDS